MTTAIAGVTRSASEAREEMGGFNHFEHWVYGADDWEVVVVLVMIILSLFNIAMRNGQFIDN